MITPIKTVLKFTDCSLKIKLAKVGNKYQHVSDDGTTISQIGKQYFTKKEALESSYDYIMNSWLNNGNDENAIILVDKPEEINEANELLKAAMMVLNNTESADHLKFKIKKYLAQ